jgi:membrane protein
MPKPDIIELAVVRESIARVRALLLDPPSAPLARRVAYPLYVLRVAIQLGKQWARDKAPIVAASLAFQSALTLVPLLAVTSALLAAAGAFDAQSALITYLSDRIFPAIGIDLFEHLMEFVQNVRHGALGPLGILITTVLAYTLFHSVENVFGQIWRIQRGRSLWSKFIVFYTLATLMPFFIGMSLYHTARYLGAGARGAAFSFASIWFALLFANKLLPRTSVRWRAAIVGATVSALLFELAKHFFTSYLTAVALARYQGVYGGLAIIPISLMWMYVAWLVILFGAECAHAAQNLHTLEALDRRARGAGHDKVNPLVAVRLVCAVAAHFRDGGKALSEEELAERFDLDELVVDQIASRLKSNDILVEVSGDVHGLLLACPPEQLTVERVFAALRPPDTRTGDPLPRVDALLRALEQARRGQVGELTIADLLSEIGPKPWASA